MTLTPEMIAQMAAAGMPATEIAKLVAAQAGGGTQAQAQGNEPAVATSAEKDQILGMLRKAPDPTNYLQGFSDDNGKYDGTYDATVVGVELRTQRNGNKIFSVKFDIDASDNDEIKIGSRKEHACFLAYDAAQSEVKGLVQTFFEACGHSGEFTNEFYFDLIGEAQPLAGQQFRLRVSTAPQKNNKNKTFTKVRWEHLPAGTVAAVAEAPVATTPAMPPEVLAALKAQGVQL